MAERPSDEWFRSAGWTECGSIRSKKFGEYTAVSRLVDQPFVYWDGPVTSPEWLLKPAFTCTPQDWEESWKRRETPLDPDGWQHFPGCSIHLAGGYRIHQWDNGEFGVYEMPHRLTNATGFTVLQDAIAACNQHARDNGVKSC